RRREGRSSRATFTERAGRSLPPPHWGGGRGKSACLTGVWRPRARPRVVIPFVFRREKSMSPKCSAPGRPFFRPTVALALLSLAVLGCAGKGDVSGKVTYQGKPLVWGTVQFEGSDNVLKQGNINSDGTYSIRGVATGEAKAAVSSINPNSSDFQVRQ